MPPGTSKSRQEKKQAHESGLSEIFGKMEVCGQAKPVDFSVFFDLETWGVSSTDISEIHRIQRVQLFL